MPAAHRTSRTTALILDYAESGLPCPVEELVDLAATYRALLALQPEPAPPAPVDRRQAIAQAAEATTRAAATGKAKRPDLAAFDAHVAALAEHQAAQDRHRASIEALTLAQQHAAEDLAAVITDNGARILAALQDHLDALVDELRSTVAPKVAHLTTLDALKAGEDVLAAYQRFEAMTVEYATMREVQAFVSPVTANDRDFRGEFVLFRNATKLYQPVRTIGISSVPPWPTGDTAAFLLWVAAHPEAELWLPTTAQRDAAHEAAYPQPAFRPVAV